MPTWEDGFEGCGPEQQIARLKAELVTQRNQINWLIMLVQDIGAVVREIENKRHRKRRAGDETASPPLSGNS